MSVQQAKDGPRHVAPHEGARGVLAEILHPVHIGVHLVEVGLVVFDEVLDVQAGPIREDEAVVGNLALGEGPTLDDMPTATG